LTSVIIEQQTAGTISTVEERSTTDKRQTRPRRCFPDCLPVVGLQSHADAERGDDDGTTKQDTMEVALGVGTHPFFNIQDADDVE
jgi:hypothetical protein